MKTQRQFNLAKLLFACLTLLMQYPVAAQTTESTNQGFKLCMNTCTSNSCSGPASVVEKNCARKCADQKTNLSPAPEKGLTVIP